MFQVLAEMNDGEVRLLKPDVADLPAASKLAREAARQRDYRKILVRSADGEVAEVHTFSAAAVALAMAAYRNWQSELSRLARMESRLHRMVSQLSPAEYEIYANETTRMDERLEQVRYPASRGPDQDWI